MIPPSKLPVLLLFVLLAACGGDGADPVADVTPTPAVTVDPQNWPLQPAVMQRDPAMEEQIAELIGRMTLEEKVGQIIQADINSVTPDEVREYNLGSILNGGGSAPGGDNRTTPDKWLELADEFWDASTDTSDGGVGIPAIWGTDAVHGNSNVLGATLFPHNIGLGMANDPDLVEQIGRVTALEILATGLDWTFAPTIAVARNDRWGRTYESYSEDPRIVAAYAPRIVEGIQGVYGTEAFLDEDHMISTAKHFVGDGGTTGGHDQGDTAVPEADLRDIHAAGYPPAVRAGVQSVMASFNSFHGRKMHGYDEMLTDVLVGRMGFDGFVVGDWNGHGQVSGCTNESCAASVNAGLDMFMAPNSWQGLYDNTLDQVRVGEISMARLEEAVARVLRVKMRMGLFDKGRPSARKHAGNFDLLAAPEHRAIARDAVRKSLVLLKNEGGLLPLSPNLNVLVAGDGAHNIGKQSGGWTLNWQGDGNLREHFPNGTSIYEGLDEVFSDAGGSVVLSEDGSFEAVPDVAIVVFGEDPYAEGVGDRPHVGYDSDDGLDLLTQFREAGIPTVSVFLSGRPLWVNPELNASDAFVAAWLPGSEGAGIADVLVGNADGSARHDFVGRLSFSWPQRADQAVLNVGDEDYDPLFAYGFGLGYTDDGALAALSDDPGVAMGGDDAGLQFVSLGDPADGWEYALRDASGEVRITGSRGVSAGGILSAEPMDRDIQEDTVLLTWSGAASVAVVGSAVNLVDETADDMALEFSFQVLEAGDTTVKVGLGGSELDVTQRIVAANQQGWQQVRLPLICFGDSGAALDAVTEPFSLSADTPLQLQLAAVRIVGNLDELACE